MNKVTLSAYKDCFVFIISLVTRQRSVDSPTLAGIMSRYASDEGCQLPTIVLRLTCFVVTFRFYYLRDIVSAVIATATWLGGWLGGWLSVCLSRYCIKTTKPILKLF